jgi:hypothetical protein
MKNLASFLTHTLVTRNVPIFAVIVAFGLTMCCSNALAQSGAGSIQGTVTDATDAVIQGASIHVVNQATGVAVDTKSNSVGFYQVPSLFTGTYVVTIGAPGMKTYVRTIELLVDQTAVINAVMTAGAVTQQVQVNADVVQLTTTDNGAVGSTLENARINQLPMNGRDLYTLANETTPGLDACNQSPSCANGLMPGATNYEVDGVTLESDEFGGANAGQSTLPDPDSVQEVRMETSGVGAQYATPAVGVLTTKSGTNQLHGSLFETARNNYWGIAKRRQDPSNLVAPQYIRNEFGASVGGPIVIPHVYHGKDKSFFFFAYERYSLAQVSYNETVTPTMAMRSGDWSGLVNGSGVLQQLYDPDTTTSNAACPTNTSGTANNTWCRTPFPKSASGAPNQIPLSRLSPTTQVIYAILPPPTTSANPLVQDNLDSRDPALTIAPTITFRLDHMFNENNRAYLRYTSVNTSNSGATAAAQPVTLAATVNGTNFPAAMYGILDTPEALFAASAGYTHVFSPTFFSETVLSQQWFGQEDINGAYAASTDIEKQIGFPNNFGENGFPEIADSLSTMNGSQGNYGLTQIVSAIDENLTKAWGKHQMQFGGRYRHERFGFLENQSHDEVLFGAYTTALENPGSGANYTGYSNTGYADADEFIGGGDQYNVWLEPPYIHFHDMEFDGYFQDNYHVARNLTLNLGLRYEAHPAPWMKDGTMAGFDLKNDAEVLGAPIASLIAEGYTTQAIITNMENDGAKFETAQQAGQPSALQDNFDLNFMPRAGFAWQPFGKWGTVIRGAYGRYTYPFPIYFSMKWVGQNDPFEAEYIQSYISAAQSPDGLPDYLLRAPQTTATPWTYASSGATPVMGTNTANIVNTTSTTAINPGINVGFLDTDDPPDQVTQANFTIEQPMKGNSVFRVSWNYSHDSNLWENYYLNDHPSSYVWEMQNGIVPPTGTVPGTNTYSATATGPYDKTTWGSSMFQVQKSGWSTDNMLQANYQRLFHRGIAYQISYIWSKPMHTGGESGSDGNVYPSADFINSAPAVSTMTSPYGTAITPALPPPQPTGTAPYAYYKALARFEYNRVDTYFPKQEIKFNGIVDLPFGSGKRFWGGANRLVNELVGGWQVAGDGNIHSIDFTITSTHWGPTNPLQVYKHKAPITDCRSGVCYKEYEWFNGYIAPTANQNVDCTTNCVSGLPSNWAPYQTPIDNAPGTTYYGDDEVSITLPGKSPAAIAYSPVSAISGANPFSKAVLNGPFNWTADASLFKAFPITERVNLRFNMDAFNVFNVQGYSNPNATDGTECVTPGGVGCSSYNPARQIQFTLRLSF